MDDALADFAFARGVYARMRTRFVCVAATGVADVHRERGELAFARSSYEEAVEMAEGCGTPCDLSRALAGLARVVTTGGELVEAERLALRAVGLGRSSGYVSAVLAAGWVALAGERRKVAAAHADEAFREASRRGDHAGLAEALELQALSGPGGEDGLPRLEQARSVWGELGNAIGVARLDLALARLSKRSASRVAARRAEGRLRALGVAVDTAAAGLLASLPREPKPAIAIFTLGGFRLERSGETARLEEWQSKKARDLLKILVARRGRPVAREFLMEVLWPGEDPRVVGGRLSVALSTVRAVLDPAKVFASERFVRADRTAVRLDLSALSVDVEDFLEDASTGLALRRAGRLDDANDALQHAEAAYAGDFLEEDAYEEWAVSLREEARAAYVTVAHALAQVALAVEPMTIRRATSARART